LNIFAHGFLDSISLHKIFPLLVSNREISTLTFKIFGANTFLLVGSITLFNEAITPGLERLRKSMIPDELAVAGIEVDTGLTKIIFYSLFVIPVYLMCYSCSAIWYQSLAENMHKARKTSSPNLMVKAVVDGTYATVAWVCLFVQVQLLTTVIPLLLSGVFPKLVGSSSSTEFFLSEAFNTEVRWHLRVVRCIIAICLSSGVLLSQSLGLFLLSVLYGWYGFDPHWTASQINPDTRFGIIEKHWAYFVGFGAPYVLLVKLTSFFVGYGWFLAMFPFCIMLGGTCDYATPYKSLKVALPPLRIFKIAQTWTLMLLKVIGKNSRTKEVAVDAPKDIKEKKSD
jgi:Etoposide-induced protein 2.4 (EI24)